MDPKLYINDGTIDIDEDICVEIMMLTLHNKYDVIFDGRYTIIIDDNGIERISSNYVKDQKCVVRQKMCCSQEWLDVLFVLSNVSGLVMIYIEEIIAQNAQDNFIKFLLIIQALMTYSGCRDINRLLLTTFFDDNYFGETCDIYTAIDSKWVKYCSLFCGHKIIYHKSLYHNDTIVTIFDNLFDESIYYVDNSTVNDVQIMSFTDADIMMLQMTDKSGHNSFAIYTKNESKYVEVYHNICCDVVTFLLHHSNIHDKSFYERVTKYKMFDIWTGSQIDIKRDHLLTCSQCSGC